MRNDSFTLRLGALGVAGLMWLTAQTWAATTPQVVTYQGRVNVSGSPFTGTGQFKFSLINPDDGASVWSNDGSHPDGTEPNTAVSVSVAGGLFTAALGDSALMSPFGVGLFESYGNLTLRIWFNDGTSGFRQLSPDQKLTAAPYALAANISAGSITGDRLAPGGIDYTRLSIGGTPSAGKSLTYDGTGFAWANGGGGPWLPSGSDIFYNAGRVGVGTASPTAPLTVDGSWDPGDVPQLRLTGQKPTIEWDTVLGTGASRRQNSWILHQGSTYLGGLDFWTRSHNFVAVPGPWQHVLSFTPDRAISFGASLRQMLNLFTTSYGIGIQDSTLYQRTGHSFAWHLNGQHSDTARDAGAGGRTLMTLDDFTASVNVADLRLGHPGRRGDPGRAFADLGDNLHVNFASDWANTTIGGATVFVRSLTITGGADLAEPFNVSEPSLEPGEVVVIDEAHPGQLKRAVNAYDARVAGVISGAGGVNPGLKLQQTGVLEGSENVALTGRVYVKVDATHGAIKPGDLLTTSDTPGHAMRADDAVRRQGAILGKAMTGLKDGQGLVLVLVTLQ